MKMCPSLSQDHLSSCDAHINRNNQPPCVSPTCGFFQRGSHAPRTSMSRNVALCAGCSTGTPKIFTPCCSNGEDASPHDGVRLHNTPPGQRMDISGGTTPAPFQTGIFPKWARVSECANILHNEPAIPILPRLDIHPWWTMAASTDLAILFKIDLTINLRKISPITSRTIFAEDNSPYLTKDFACAERILRASQVRRRTRRVLSDDDFPLTLFPSWCLEDGVGHRGFM